MLRIENSKTNKMLKIETGYQLKHQCRDNLLRLNIPAVVIPADLDPPVVDLLRLRVGHLSLRLGINLFQPFLRNIIRNAPFGGLARPV